MNFQAWSCALFTLASPAFATEGDAGDPFLGLLERASQVQQALHDIERVLATPPVADNADAGYEAGDGGGTHAHDLRDLLAQQADVLRQLSTLPKTLEIADVAGADANTRAAEDVRTAADALRRIAIPWKYGLESPPHGLPAAMARLQEADVKLREEHQKGIDQLGKLSQPTAIIISGGVSLGSYQAGLLHYYTQYLLQQRKSIERLSPGIAQQPQTVTGASAGAINAFLAAIVGCREEVTKPQESLFYKLWVPIGLKGLMIPEDVTASSLLSRRPIEAAVALVTDLWRTDGWRKVPCKVNLGLTVTRVDPRYVPLNTDDKAIGRVVLPIQTEHVILGIDGEEGKPPRVRSWTPSTIDKEANPDFYPVFPMGTDEADLFPFEAKSLLKASASFPVAWPFVRLKLSAQGGRADFLDGGIFDNNPLRLASRLVDWGRCGARHPKSPSECKPGEQKPRLLYVEPDATAWDSSAPSSHDHRTSFLDTYPALLGNLVTTARKAELVATIEGDSTLSARVDVPPRRAPITGGYLLNFLAFLEEDFRRFDFFMGMADASQFLGATNASNVPRLGLKSLHVDSPEFDCVVAFRKEPGAPSADAVPACHKLLTDSAEDAHARNFLALLDTSTGVRSFIDRCLEKSSGCTPGDEFEEFSRLLQKNHYVFEDPEAKGQSVVEAMREKLQPMMGQFAGEQPTFAERAGLAVVGKAGLDALHYRPSGWYLGVGLHSRNGFEVEFSGRLGKVFRMDVGQRITRIQTRFVRGTDALEQHGSATLENYFNPLSLEFAPSWWVQLGIQLGMGVNIETVGLNPAAFRFPVAGALTATLLQRIYIRVNGSVFIDSCSSNDCRNVIKGYQSDGQVLAGTPGDWSVSIGWRFLQ